MKVAVACGGTGGHIIPGVTAAEALRLRGHDVTLWLAGRDVEKGATEGWRGGVERIAVHGISPELSVKGLLSCGRLAVGILKSYIRMRRCRPDVLLAMGSYASVGPVLAARWLGVPVVLHEANAVPGRAIDFLSRYADVVAVAFPAAARYFPSVRVEVTGFPLRADLGERFDVGSLLPDRFNVLVMGGSQGAHVLNEVAAGALIRLHRDGLPIQVIHLAGRKDAAQVGSRYSEAKLPAMVHDFLRDMGKAYGAVSMAVARSGAGTCMELAACGVPALLVPLPTAARNHQLANARAMAEAGGMDVMEERDLSETALAEYIRGCYGDPVRLGRMRDRLKVGAGASATGRVVALVESFGAGRG